jgi:hypothetical protein
MTAAQGTTVEAQIYSIDKVHSDMGLARSRGH